MPLILRPRLAWNALRNHFCILVYYCPFLLIVSKFVCLQLLILWTHRLPMESYASWSQSRPSSSPELCFQSRLAQNLEAARNLVKDMCHIVHLQCCVSGLLQMSSTHDDMITHFVTRAQQASMEKGLSTTCFTQPALLTAVAAGAQVKRTEVQSHQACQNLCNAGHPAVTVLQYSRTQCDIVSKHPSTVFINRGCNVDDQDMRQQHTSCRDDAVPVAYRHLE